MQQHRPDRVLIAIRDLPEARLRAIVELAHVCGSRVSIIPSVLEQATRATSSGALRELRIDDLIGRPAVRLDPGDPEIAATYSGRVILVTGAGGSIGSELVRQLVRLAPRRLLLLDKDENTLFRIDQELSDESVRQERVLLVRDLRDRASTIEVFRRYRPEVVLHAAAHKHVPLMETNPLEAARNNVLVTDELTRIAAKSGTGVFVFISTDKAVHPTSVMGATKRLCELIVRSRSHRSRTRFAVVRFGNVLGSQGSVVETFLRQIHRGGPVTVTHPDVTRYFLTAPEATQLVVVAGAVRRPPGVLVLEMGRARRILDLARDMIRLYALDPSRVAIVTTGLRGGEKLSEELSASGRLVELPDRPGILVDPEPPGDPQAIAKQLETSRPRPSGRATRRAPGGCSSVRQIPGRTDRATAPGTAGRGHLPNLAEPGQEGIVFRDATPDRKAQRCKPYYHPVGVFVRILLGLGCPFIGKTTRRAPIQGWGSLAESIP